MKRLAPLLLTWGLAGCAGMASPPARGFGPQPPRPEDDCIRRCVQSSQARAVSPQLIYDECEADCKTRPLAPE